MQLAGKDLIRIGVVFAPLLALSGILTSCTVSTHATAPDTKISDIPIPASRLLRPPRAPRCQFAGRQNSKPTDAASLSKEVRLEFERNCYREAERKVRSNLRALQREVSLTAKAVQQNSPKTN